MPIEAHDLRHGDRVYLIRDGGRIFAVPAVLVEVGEIHHEGVREQAANALGDRAVATQLVADSAPEIRARAQKTFVGETA